jgi:hypothetical protein
MVYFTESAALKFKRQKVEKEILVYSILFYRDSNWDLQVSRTGKHAMSFFGLHKKGQEMDKYSVLHCIIKK